MPYYRCNLSGGGEELDLKITISITASLFFDNSPQGNQTKASIYRYTDGTVTKISGTNPSASDGTGGGVGTAKATASISQVLVEPWEDG